MNPWSHQGRIVIGAMDNLCFGPCSSWGLQKAGHILLHSHRLCCIMVYMFIQVVGNRTSGWDGHPVHELPQSSGSWNVALMSIGKETYRQSGYIPNISRARWFLKTLDIVDPPRLLRLWVCNLWFSRYCKTTTPSKSQRNGTPQPLVCFRNEGLHAHHEAIPTSLITRTSPSMTKMKRKYICKCSRAECVT